MKNRGQKKKSGNSIALIGNNKESRSRHSNPSGNGLIRLIDQIIPLQQLHQINQINQMVSKVKLGKVYYMIGKPYHLILILIVAEVINLRILKPMVKEIRVL